MIEINSKIWKSFNINDIFIIEKGFRYDANKINTKRECGIPYITRTTKNNGVSGFVDFSENLRINKGKSISVGWLGTFFYQESDFICGTDIFILRNRKINIFNSLFLINVLSLYFSKITSYGRGINYNRIISARIKLPSTDSGEPDWQFMEDYIKQFEETKLLEIQETGYNCDAVSLSRIVKFRIGDIFNLNIGKSYSKRQLPLSEVGDVFYITRSSFKNGVQGFISNEFIIDNEISVNKGGCITVGAEGKKAFYQPLDFITGTNVTIIRNENINELISLYLVVIIDKAISEVCSYARAATYGRLNDILIPLPSKLDGSPDWDSIEKYMKSLPYSEMI